MFKFRPASRGSRGVWSILKGSLVTTFWGCLSGSGSRVEVLCCVRVCESASLRYSLVMKWVWSPYPCVHSEIIWSRVSPNRASGLGLYWLTMAKRCLNPCKGSGWRWTKWMVLFVFPCVLEKRTPYLLSMPSSLPSLSLSRCLANSRNRRRSE
jgi:hypothetical protein